MCNRSSSLNMFSKDMNFDVVRNAYCRVVSEEGEELRRVGLSGSSSDKPGLIFARLFRMPESEWGFERVGTFCGGRTWMDPACIDAMRRSVFLKEMQRSSPEFRCQLKRRGRRLSCVKFDLNLPGCKAALGIPPANSYVVSL